MNREQLFDLTERVKLVAGVELPVIVGSQSLYGVTPHVPDIVKRSVECDFLLLAAGPPVFRAVEAEAVYRQALAYREKAYGTNDKAVSVSLINLGDLYLKRDQLTEAEVMSKRALGLLAAAPERRETLSRRNVSLHESGHHSGARGRQEEGVRPRGELL